MTEGRFGGIASIYDPEDALADGRLATRHNAYGYIAATNNYQVLRGRCAFFVYVWRGVLVVFVSGHRVLFLFLFWRFWTPATTAWDARSTVVFGASRLVFLLTSYIGMW